MYSLIAIGIQRAACALAVHMPHSGLTGTFQNRAHDLLSKLLAPHRGHVLWLPLSSGNSTAVLITWLGIVCMHSP